MELEKSSTYIKIFKGALISRGIVHVAYVAVIYHIWKEGNNGIFCFPDLPASGIVKQNVADIKSRISWKIMLYLSIQWKAKSLIKEGKQQLQIWLGKQQPQKLL